MTILGVGEDRTLPAFARISEPSDDAPGVYLLFQYGRYVARPADAPPGKWFMASGAHLHTSDSRWRELIGHSSCCPAGTLGPASNWVWAVCGRLTPAAA